MLDTSKTQFLLTTNKPVAGDLSIMGILDGVGLISVLENGVQKVKVPETATNNDIFEGIAFSQYRAQVSSNAVDTFIVPVGGGTAVLKATPIGGESKVMARIYEADGTTTEAADTAVASVPKAGQVQLTGNTVAFNAADAGKKVEITYNYNLSAIEIQSTSFMGDGVPGPAVTAMTGEVSIGQKGNYYTDQYDTAVDWNSMTKDIKVGNGGIFTRGSSAVGADVNGVVCHVPTSDVPFLGIELF